jgi:glyoxylase-like metal-dependent hydrolase (beta-lactamase superfamily II)
MYDAIDHATLAFPTASLRTAQLPKRIDLGGISAVIEFHPGHTPTDVILRVPQRDVVFAGDLLFNNAYPVSLDADMIAWRGVLELFSGYDQRTRFVPGHGPVCGLDTVRDQCALFDDLRAHAEKMMRVGATAEEAGRRYVVPERFQNFSIHSWDFTIGAAMRSYFARLNTPRPAE